MACAFCYYGLVLMTTQLFEASNSLCTAEPINNLKFETCAAECKQLQTTDYMDLLWTTLAEFPGIIPNLINSHEIKKPILQAFL